MKRRVVVQGAGVLLLVAAFVLLGGSFLLDPDDARPGWGPVAELDPASDAAPARLDAPRGGAPAPSAEDDGLAADPDLDDLPLGAVIPADADDLEAEEPVPARGDPGDGHALEVQVDGEPLPGARVRIYRAAQVGGRALYEVRTDGRGRAVLPPPQDDALLAVVEAPGHAPTGVDFDEAQRALDLAERALVPGRVVGPDGTGVEAQVRVRLGAFVVAETRSRASGDFQLALPDGAPGLLLEVEAPGYHPLRRALADSSGLSWVELRLGDVGRVVGRVVDELGQPAPEVLLRATTSEQAAATTQTDLDGRFTLDALRAGPVDLELYLADAVPVTVSTAQVRAGETTALELIVRRPGELRVTVTDGAGPIAEAEVRIVDPTTTRYGGFAASGAQQTGETRDDGRVTFGLPAGRYYVRVRHRGQEASAEAVVAAGALAEAQVDLTEKRSLRVRVVDPQGNPVAGVFMDVSMPSIQWSSMPSGTSGADGVVTFEALPSGLAGVHVGKGGQWRMVYTEAEAAELVWTGVSQLRLLGTAQAQGELLAACVLPDTVKMEPLAVEGGLLDAELTPPDGARDVWVLAPDAGLAPAFLGHAELGQPELVGLELAFAPGATVRGRMVCAAGAGVPGEVRVEGSLGGVLEARAQWLGGTDHDPWITVNEWGQSSASDGSFELDGVPAGTHTVTLRAVGCQPRTLTLTVEAGQTLELGALTLDAP